MQVANTPRVLEWVAEGRVPLGIVEGRLRSPRVRLERWLEDEVVLIASPSVPAFRQVTRAADLASVPLLLREPGSNTRAVVEEALQRALGKGRMPRSELLFGSNQSIKMAVAAGLGVAFVSRWSVQHNLAAGRFLAWARRNPPKAP